MKSQIATDRSQSQRLLDCGVDPDSADMSLDIDTDKLYLGAYSERVDAKHEIPAWSLSRLISLLPKMIVSDAYGYIWLEIVWLYEENSIPAIRYFTPPNENGDEPDQWEFTDESIIECAVQAIEWIKENDYKLNGIRQ